MFFSPTLLDFLADINHTLHCCYIWPFFQNHFHKLYLYSFLEYIIPHIGTHVKHLGGFSETFSANLLNKTPQIT